MATSRMSSQKAAGRRSGDTTRVVLSCEPSPGWLWFPQPSPTSAAEGLTRIERDDRCSDHAGLTALLHKGSGEKSGPLYPPRISPAKQRFFSGRCWDRTSDL